MARWGSGLPSRIPHMSDKPVDQLIQILGSGQGASMGLTVFGVYLIAKHAFQYLMERKRHWEMRKRVLAAATKRAGKEEEGVNGKVENISDTAKKDKMMPDLCVICLEQEYNVVFTPNQDGCTGSQNKEIDGRRKSIRNLSRH